MCGIAGFLDSRGELKQQENLLKVMGASLAHRGPDDAGSWFDPLTGIGLSHRRLSIIDTTDGGHQPMHSVNGRFVVVYNGEIYNFLDLRAQLMGLGASFFGKSDTEVLLAGFVHWGIRETVLRCNGMFAFAVWDRDERRLHLYRDRIGIKPLYWGAIGHLLVFASEPVAFYSVPGFEAAIDRDSLALLLRHNCIPAPRSIWRGIGKLLPGHCVEIAEGAAGALPCPTCWWSPRQALLDGKSSPFAGSASEAEEELAFLLEDAVGRQMISDVPLGAFLSGGIDSSLVVALMQARASARVSTFSIGFEVDSMNEAPYASKVASHLGTDHNELIVTERECMEVVPKLGAIFSEPFSDASQIPTYLVSRLARQQVTVALSGDGGDEMFAGYVHYSLGQSLHALHRRYPYWLRVAVARGVECVPSVLWKVAPKKWGHILAGDGELALTADRILKAAKIISKRDFRSMYCAMQSHWQQPELLVLGANTVPTVANGLGGPWPDTSVVDQLAWLDQEMYLPDDILVKVDRASMAVGLEARVPLLDHRIVEFSWRLPTEFKIRDGYSKWLLRRVLARHVPRDLTERPKKGFSVPLPNWLRGPLRPWAEELLGEGRLREEGYFDAKAVTKAWQEFQCGQREWAPHLWDILMFQLWHEEVKRSRPTRLVQA